MKKRRIISVFFLIGVLAVSIVSGCGGKASGAAAERTGAAAEESAAAEPFTESAAASEEASSASDAVSEESSFEIIAVPEESEPDFNLMDLYSTSDQPRPTTVFIDEPFYDGIIKDENDALEAIYSVMDRLGGDETIELVYHDGYKNDEDTSFYSFEQALGGIQVENANVKLVADKDGQAVGLISTLVCGQEADPNHVWEITQEEAEAKVPAQYLASGAKVLPEATEETVIMDDNSGYMTYVWVVYSTNPSPENGKAYNAHYISGSGEYLYSLPVFEPGNEDALSGAVPLFAFDGYEEGVWTGTVKDSDGQERTITVPVLIDSGTGAAILGDPQRKILCADSTDFSKKGTLSPITSADGAWVNNELITYEMFIRVWDFYDNIGWHGPDADGTPTLILMNLLDENGEPENNAYYGGKEKGFQTFHVNDAFGDGSCSDIIGHEFTHCVTQKSMGGCNYQDDFGAINESISDIMGNLIEMSFGDSPGGEWLFSERHSRGTVRSMKDPHAFGQPEYVWDQYYVPAPAIPEENNDMGGVHIKNSILNYIACQLDQAGMPLEDQIYFWMNVDLSLTASTDYPLLARLLPWCLKLTGYSEYSEALDNAIKYADLERTEAPETAKDDQAVVKLELPFDPAEKAVSVLLTFQRRGEDRIIWTWPAAGTKEITVVLPEGDYITVLSVRAWDLFDTLSFYLLTPGGWISAKGNIPYIFLNYPKDQVEASFTHFAAGEVQKLTSTGLPAK